MSDDYDFDHDEWEDVDFDNVEGIEIYFDEDGAADIFLLVDGEYESFGTLSPDEVGDLIWDDLYWLADELDIPFEAMEDYA